MKYLTTVIILLFSANSYALAPWVVPFVAGSGATAVGGATAVMFSSNGENQNLLIQQDKVKDFEAAALERGYTVEVVGMLPPIKAWSLEEKALYADSQSSCEPFANYKGEVESLWLTLTSGYNVKHSNIQVPTVIGKETAQRCAALVMQRYMLNFVISTDGEQHYLYIMNFNKDFIYPKWEGINLYSRMSKAFPAFESGSEILEWRVIRFGVFITFCGLVWVFSVFITNKVVKWSIISMLAILGAIFVP